MSTRQELLAGDQIDINFGEERSRLPPFSANKGGANILNPLVPPFEWRSHHQCQPIYIGRPIASSTHDVPVCKIFDTFHINYWSEWRSQRYKALNSYAGFVFNEPTRVAAYSLQSSQQYSSHLQYTPRLWRLEAHRQGDETAPDDEWEVLHDEYSVHEAPDWNLGEVRTFMIDASRQGYFKSYRVVSLQDTVFTCYSQMQFFGGVSVDKKNLLVAADSVEVTQVEEASLMHDAQVVEVQRLKYECEHRCYGNKYARAQGISL